jgi:hypothetical protein
MHEDNKKNIIEKIKDESVLLAVATGLATYVGFIYQVGYLKFFGVPLSLVHIDLNRMVVALALVVGFGLLFYVPLGLLKAVASINKLAAQVLLRPLVISCLFTPLAYLTGADATAYYLIFGFSSVVLAVSLIEPLFGRKNNETYLNKLRGHLNDDREVSYNKDFFLDAASFLAAISFVCLLLGNWQASHQTTFWQVDGRPDYVVADIYGDTIVLTKIELGSKTILDDLRVINISQQSGGVNLIEADIGPLMRRSNLAD